MNPKIGRLFTLSVATFLAVAITTAATPADRTSAINLSRLTAVPVGTMLDLECASTCYECQYMGSVGSARYSGPLLNDERLPNGGVCEIESSCWFCGFEAQQAAAEVEAAAAASDWSKIALVAESRGNVIPDTERDVVDVMGCDGTQVVATFAVPHRVVASMAFIRGTFDVRANVGSPF